MYSGKQKAKILLGLLGDGAQRVLSLLSPDSAAILTSDVDESPELEQKALQDFIKTTFEAIEQAENEPFSDSGSDFSLDSLDDTSVTSGSSFLDEPLGSDSSETPSFLDLDEPEKPKEVQEVKVDNLPSDFRKPQEIADLLGEQKPQIVAFFLSKLTDENLKSQIDACLPEKVAAQVRAAQIDNIPLSDLVFKKLYEKIVKKSESA